MKTYLEFIFFLLSSFGLSFIVTQSKLFLPLRNYVRQKSQYFSSLLSCILCFGTWSGFLVRFLIMIWLREPFTFVWRDGIDIFLHGLIGGIVAYFGYLIYLKLNGDKV